MSEISGVKENNSSIVIRSGMWFAICNVITKGVGFFTTPIFTRLLTKAEFGDFNNFTTWTGIILLVTSLNLESSMIRARFDFRDDLDNYVASMLCLSAISTVIWFFLVLFFINPIKKLLFFNKNEIYAMFLYLLFYPAIQLFQTRERYEYKYKATVVISLLVVISTSLLSVILVILMENKFVGRVIGCVLPIIVIGFIISFIIFRNGGRINIKFWKYAIPFTIPFIPHLLSMYLLGSMDKVMIKQLCGSEDLALYSLAYTVGTVISLLVNAMNGAFSPWLGEQLSKKKYGSVRKVSIPYVAFFTLFSIIAVLITPEILFILGGKEYSDARFVIPQIFASCLVQFIYCMYVNVEQFEKRTVGMAIASVIAALFNYVTNYIFIRKFGYIAASYTTFFSYLLLMILHIYLVRRIGRRGIFADRIIILIGLVGSVILICTNIIFEDTVIRYIIFGVMLGSSLFVAYKHRNVLSRFILRRS